MRGAAPLTSRTGLRGIDTRFADFSRSVSPGKPFLAGRLPGLHHVVERSHRNRQVVQTIFLLPGCPISRVLCEKWGFWLEQKEVEKLKYMHRNPVVRGLVASPEDWRWSSYRSYAYGEAGLVRINDWTWWEDKIRRSAGRRLGG